MSVILESTSRTLRANERRSLQMKPSSLSDAVIVTIIIFGFILLSILTWKILVWTRRKASKSRGGFTIDPSDVEKNNRDPVLLPSKAHPDAMWTPQIKPFGNTIQQPAPVLQAPPPTKNLAPLVVTNRASEHYMLNTPPPQYKASNSPHPDTSKFRFPPPIVPPVPAAFGPTNPPSTVVPSLNSEKLVPPSPTRSFFSGISSRVSIITLKRCEQQFPRLMDVVNDFHPTLPDELTVTAGQTVQLLDEYTDGWCMIHFLGVGAAKGVIPRCCLAEHSSSGDFTRMEPQRL